MSERTLWQQADAILDSLLDLPNEERAEKLATMELAPELRERIGQLLHAHARAGGVLDVPIFHNDADVAPVAMAGRRFGAWLIDSEIGRGGMSVVYRARHVEHPERSAALKLVTLGALVGAGIERFRREQSILSRLNHPHIATLFDAGVADDGTPWLAMALVDGERIDQWCDARELDVRARVRLLIDVCGAVAYAHQNLVVHRDLKPSNVLVDRDGHVRLLDFGVARLVDESSESTASAHRAFTPSYAAPEQFSATPAATTIDVYGLGALMFAVFVGRPPRAPGQSEHTEPTAPSRALAEGSPTFPARTRAVRGDLDAVVLKALALDPAQRYASASELAEDLRRWLRAEPVSAHTASVGYRVSKFISRHRVGVAASVTIVLLLSAGLASTLWQAERARQESAKALLQAKRATETKAFLLDIFAAADPEMRRADPPNLSELIERGAEKLDAAFQDTPALRAEMQIVLGELFRVVGKHARAKVLIDAGLAYAETATDTDLLRSALSARALLAGAESDFALATQLNRRGLEFVREHDPENANAWLGYVDGLSYALDQSGHLDQATALVQDAMARRPDNLGPLLLARLQRLTAQYSDPTTADKLLREALPTIATTPGERRTLLLIYSNLGTTSFQLNRNAESLEFYSKALALAQQTYAPPHRMLALVQTNVASIYSRLGRFGEAQSALSAAREIYRAAGLDDSPEVAAVVNNQGNMLVSAGRPAEAEPWLREAAARALHAFGERDWRYGSARVAIAWSLSEQGKHREAAAEIAKALAVIQASAPREVAHNLFELAARIALEAKDPTTALTHTQHAETLLADSKAATAGTRLRIAVDRARAYVMLDRANAAVEHFARASQLAADTTSTISARDKAYAAESQGDFEAVRGNHAAARELWQLALRHRLAANLQEHPQTTALEHKLGPGG